MLRKASRQVFAYELLQGADIVFTVLALVSVRRAPAAGSWRGERELCPDVGEWRPSVGGRFSACVRGREGGGGTRGEPKAKALGLPTEEGGGGGEAFLKALCAHGASCHPHDTLRGSPFLADAPSTFRPRRREWKATRCPWWAPWPCSHSLPPPSALSCSLKCATDSSVEGEDRGAHASAKGNGARSSTLSASASACVEHHNRRHRRPPQVQTAPLGRPSLSPASAAVRGPLHLPPRGVPRPLSA